MLLSSSLRHSVWVHTFIAPFMLPESACGSYWMRSFARRFEASSSDAAPTTALGHGLPAPCHRPWTDLQCARGFATVDSWLGRGRLSLPLSQVGTIIGGDSGPSRGQGIDLVESLNLWWFV